MKCSITEVTHRHSAYSSLTRTSFTAPTQGKVQSCWLGRLRAENWKQLVNNINDSCSLFQVLWGAQEMPLFYFQGLSFWVLTPMGIGTRKTFLKVLKFPNEFWREGEGFCLLKTLQQYFAVCSSRPPASESQGSLSNTRFPGLLPRLSESQLLGLEPRELCFWKVPRCKLKLENHCFKKEIKLPLEWHTLVLPRNRKGNLSSPLVVYSRAAV